MNNIDNIIKFRTKNTNSNYKFDNIEESSSMISYPTEQELFVMNKLIQQYADQHPNEMIPFNMWDGDCYHTVFKEMAAYAEEIGEDPWDVFALFINKLNGWRMEIDDNGGVTVKYRKD